MVKCIEHGTGDAHVHYSDNTLLLLNKDILTVVRDKGWAEVMIESKALFTRARISTHFWLHATDLNPPIKVSFE